jgi:hypothetical protein
VNVTDALIVDAVRSSCGQAIAAVIERFCGASTEVTRSARSRHTLMTISPVRS